MKISAYIVTSVLLASGISLSHAQENTPSMPMYGPYGPQGQQMHPMMMERMMRMREHRRMMQQQPASAQDTKADSNAHAAVATQPHTCHHMKSSGMHAGKKQMMMERMQNMEKHMQKVESHLKNIEDLMREMVKKMD